MTNSKRQPQRQPAHVSLERVVMVVVVPSGRLIVVWVMADASVGTGGDRCVSPRICKRALRDHRRVVGLLGMIAVAAAERPMRRLPSDGTRTRFVIRIPGAVQRLRYLRAGGDDVRRRGVAHGGLKMLHLVVEVDIRLEHLKDPPLRDSSEEERLINPDPPRPKGVHHPGMGRCAPGGHQRDANRSGTLWELLLDVLQCSQERFERTRIHRLVRQTQLALLKRLESLLLEHTLGPAVEEDRVTVESNPDNAGNLIVSRRRWCAHECRWNAKQQGGRNVRRVGGQEQAAVKGGEVARRVPTIGEGAACDVELVVPDRIEDAHAGIRIIPRDHHHLDEMAVPRGVDVEEATDEPECRSLCEGHLLLNVEGLDGDLDGLQALCGAAEPTVIIDGALGSPRLLAPSA